jgi:hypothetical protein
MTDPKDSPVTSRRSLPVESKISMQRGFFILPEQKISISGCHVAWKVVNQRPGVYVEVTTTKKASRVRSLHRTRVSNRCNC